MYIHHGSSLIFNCFSSIINPFFFLFLFSSCYLSPLLASYPFQNVIDLSLIFTPTFLVRRLHFTLLCFPPFVITAFIFPVLLFIFISSLLLFYSSPVISVTSCPSPVRVGSCPIHMERNIQSFNRSK